MPVLRAAGAPAFLLAEEADARIRELLHDRGAAVGRAVVHDDELKIGERLFENRPDGRIDIAGLIVERHHHGYRRRRFPPTLVVKT
jgi:hypothetical protein